MKKLLFILTLFVLTISVKAQFVRPTGIVAVPSYTFWRNPADTSITIYQGSVNLYNTFVQHFDTVKLSGWVNNRKLLKYRLIGDSILKDGTASNYKLLHKIDSIMALVKYRNDTVVITGYATRGYVQRNFVAKNDSSKLYERIANKVTSISAGSTDIQYPSGKLLYDQLLQKRALNNHDSLSKLDERKYQSLTDTLTWGLGLSQTGHVTKVDTTSASILSRQRALKEYTAKNDSSKYYEKLVNKSTNVTTDGASDVKYPSAKAVKTYADLKVALADSGKTSAGNYVTAKQLALKQPLATVLTNIQDTLNLHEHLANKSTTTTLGTSNILYPTQNAVKTYIDTHAGLTTTAHGLGASAFHADSYFQTALTNPTTGIGTTNYLSKWTGSTTLGNSGFFDNGTSVFYNGNRYSYLDGSVVRFYTGPSGYNINTYDNSANLFHLANTGNIIVNANISGDWGLTVNNTVGSNGYGIVSTLADAGDTYSLATYCGGDFRFWSKGNGDAYVGRNLTVNDGGYFTTLVQAPTIKLTTGAAVGKAWVCTNATTGAGEWSTFTNTQTFISTWNATTNTPTLADGTGTSGYYHNVTTAGTVNLGSGSVTYEVGDAVIYNGTIWQRLPKPIITGAALTVTDDTNVTLTRGGSPDTALLNAASLTVGWTGTLADGRIASAGNWNTAFGQTRQWDGETGAWFDAATGRASLGLGSAALSTTTDFLSSLGGNVAGDIVIQKTVGNGSFINVNDAGTIYSVLDYTSLQSHGSDLLLTSTGNVKANGHTVWTAGNFTDNHVVWDAKESALTFGLGLNRTVNAIKIDTTDVSILSRQRAANTYLGKYSTATNSSLLENHNAAYFQIAGNYVNKETGKHLPDNNFTDADSTKLLGIAAGATVELTFGTVTSVAALTLGTTGTDLSSSVATGTITPVITLNVPTASAANRGALSAADWSTFNNKEPAITAGTTSQYWRGDKTWQTLPSAGTGTVTSVAMSVPTGLSISGTPITTSGTLAVTLTSGYVIPTTTNISTWNGLTTNATHSGDATGSGALTLATVNSNVGTYQGITVNAKGLVTAASNQSYQAALVNTTNIKSINGTTLLGSGDLSTTQTTVSGNAGTVTVANDNTTNTDYYPVWTAGAGSAALKISSPALTYNPYYKNLTVTGGYVFAVGLYTNTITSQSGASLRISLPTGNTGTSGQVLTSGGAGTMTWSTPSGGGSGMTWPASAGIAVYSGSSSWATSITNNSANWNTAYGWGNHATAGYATGTINNATLTLATSGSGISGSQTFTANQASGATFTVASNATTSNTAGTIVLRDGSGYVSLTGTFCSSDSTLKRNIRSLSKIDLYNASKIDLRKFWFKAENDQKNHFGVIAQDVQKLFPELINTSKETGKLEVNYPELSILLIAQQKEEIQLLKEQNRQLEKRIEKLEDHNKWEAKQINF